MKFSIYVFVAFLLMLLLVGRTVQAEPVFCSIEYFKSHENKTNAPHTSRLHEFQIGDLTLSGLAVGASDAKEVSEFSKAPANLKYCTWYLNSGNKEAEKIFHHTHLVGPYLSWLPWISDKDIANDFETVLNPELPGMLTCIEGYNYLAAGCDGQRHRGPSEFAWFLSLAGCNPNTSTDIANHFWALNGVPYSTRLEIAHRGQITGDKYPEYRRRMQRVMIKK